MPTSRSTAVRCCRNRSLGALRSSRAPASGTRRQSRAEVDVTAALRRQERRAAALRAADGGYAASTATPCSPSTRVCELRPRKWPSRRSRRRARPKPRRAGRTACTLGASRPRGPRGQARARGGPRKAAAPRTARARPPGTRSETMPHTRDTRPRQKSQISTRGQNKVVLLTCFLLKTHFLSTALPP